MTASRRAWLAVAAIALSVAGTAAEARGGAALAPGQYVWAEDAAYSAPAYGAISIVISIADQRAYVYRGSALLAVSAVSTGREGHRTPVGTFTVLEKAVTHRSNKYSNAPMPYMQRLTWDGIALHGGMNPGYPASHGCIRLPLAFAKRLFAVTRLGATVTITAAPVDEALPAPLPAPAPRPVLPRPVSPLAAPPTYATAAPLPARARPAAPMVVVDLPSDAIAPGN